MYYSLLYNQYILKCDLLYKYQKKDIYKIPKLKSLVLNFSLDKFLNTLENQFKEDLNANEINFFLLFYLISCNFSYIKFKTVKKNNISKDSLSIKLIFLKTKKIDQFLFEFFHFYYRFYQNILFDSNNISSKQIKQNENKDFNFFFKISSYNSPEINLYFQKILNLTNFKDFNFFLNFKI
jgi:hypothetical protein